MTAQLPGFSSESRSFVFDHRQPQQVDFSMPASSVGENVTISAESDSMIESTRRVRPAEPSQNVINLQRRAAGVLPVRVDVPRAGTSHSSSSRWSSIRRRW